MAMSESFLKDIRRQNEILIALLGRIAFDEKTVRDIIISNKKEDLKSKYIEGYNACDGNKTQTEIANVIGVTQSTLSPIINEWVEVGIVYEINKGNKKSYKKIFPIKVDWLASESELFKKIIEELNDYVFRTHKLPSVSDISEIIGISDSKCSELCDTLEGQKQIYVVSGGGKGKPKIIIPYYMIDIILNTQQKPDWIIKNEYSFEEIGDLNSRIKEYNDKLSELYKFQFLLYGTDVPLERSITYALDYLGFKGVTHHEDNKNYADVTFWHDDVKYIIEVEGTTKKGDKAKVLQLDGWFKVEIEGGTSVDTLKGIFFVNHERIISPDLRGIPLTPHAIEYMKRYNFILMTTPLLFNTIKDVYYKKITKESAKDVVINGIKMEDLKWMMINLIY